MGTHGICMNFLKERPPFELYTLQTTQIRPTQGILLFGGGYF
jgi:hypothetical protein